MINNDVTDCPDIVLGRDVAFIIPESLYITALLTIVIIACLLGIMIGISFFAKKKTNKEVATNGQDKS